MAKEHLKRLVAPRNWPIKRKEKKWVARPMPGPHALHESITLNIIIRDILKYAKVKKEVKEILNKGKIFVDKVIRKELKFPIGAMDVFEIPELKESYRILYDKNGKFILHKIKDEETTIKPCKIIGKIVLKGKKIQLNLNDGRNKLVDKDNYKVGDTIILDLQKKIIKDHIKFEKGALVYVIGGKYTGYYGILEEIINVKPAKIIFKTDDKKIRTLKEYCLVVGRGKEAVISLPK